MSYLTRQQIINSSTGALISHYGYSVEIEVKRSSHNRIPCIVFRSVSKGLVNALATHHAAKLSKMCPTWKPWTSGVRYDKTTEGLAYTVISLKGLTPKVLRAWLDAATTRGFKVTVEDGILPPVKETTESTESTVEVVESIPTKARAVATHKPFGLPGKVATCAELRKVLRAQGKDTRGNKAALLARL